LIRARWSAANSSTKSCSLSRKNRAFRRKTCGWSPPSVCDHRYVCANKRLNNDSATHTAATFTRKHSGFQLFTDKKIQDFSRTFQDPMKNFPRPFRSPRMLKSYQSYSRYSECSPLQKNSTLYLIKHKRSIAACVPFEPLGK